MNRRSFNLSRAFTLVELLTVVAILSLLLSMLVPAMDRARRKARMTYCAANLHQIGAGFAMYLSQFKTLYPYGVPKDPTVLNHPQYETWLPDSHGGGVPPQQQFYTLKYIENLSTWICPTDPHPGNYNWWEYSVHPDIKQGSSYMFSEQAIYGVIWWTKRVFNAGMVVDAGSFGLASDGWMCPNGWHWGTVDPAYELNRIDWSHDDQVNFLWGDFHVAPKPQLGASALIRSNPLNLDPLHTWY